MAKTGKSTFRIVLVLGCLTAMLMAGCATSRGFGQDVQSLGRNIEKTGQ